MNFHTVSIYSTMNFITQIILKNTVLKNMKKKMGIMNTARARDVWAGTKGPRGQVEATPSGRREKG